MHRLALVCALALVACRNEKTEISDTADPYYGTEDDTARGGLDDTGGDDDTGDTGAEPAPDDVDGDGYYAPGTSSDPTLPEDCDDEDASVNPGADELCDGIDNDCDGDIDEDDAVDAAIWYLDDDGDGYGAGDGDAACAQPEGYAAVSGDCDDSDAAWNPGAEESDCADPNDYNCDGSVGYDDADGDGYAACEECDDSDGAVNPGATEVCNDVDDDCDGAADEDAADAASWYADGDGDGYGDPGASAQSCDQPSGYVSDDQDCDDADAAINPETVWYIDYDGDGWGSGSLSQTECEQPSGFVSDDSDCDDTDAASYPGADEGCDDADNDCDEVVDEDAIDPGIFYADADADGYGDPSSSVEGCDGLEGYTDDGSDCDDSDAAVYPGADELCDGEDGDCDGDVDEDAADADAWYLDADADGYGDADVSLVACDQPSSAVADGSDCDDGDSAVYPGADELCDGEDGDCDGDVDEDAADADTWYLDADADGYGLDSEAYSVTSCEAPSGYAAYAGDCDDGDSDYNPGAAEDDCADPNDYNCDGSVAYSDGDGDGYAACEECDDADGAINPDAEETCDDADNDCDGAIDESGGAATWYADGDGDGYGDDEDAVASCAAPSGYVSEGGDCDDADADANPETIWYLDADGDSYGGAGAALIQCEQPAGYTDNTDDCDDLDGDAYPGADETCDGEDGDCDGAVDEDAADVSTWYADADGDGYGDAGTSAQSCEAPSGYISDASDCDDGEAAANPGEREVCDGLDNDCDGDTDGGALDAATWYADADGDGYGDAASAVEACEDPGGYADDDSDCDDGDGAVYPGADETCDDADDDCDGAVDEDATDAATWYIDNDGDGYGATDYTLEACDQPSGYVADSSDCDGLDGASYPGADETCDDEDDDCDGTVDEDGAVDASDWYADGDGDGFGDPSDVLVSCAAPSGYLADSEDCDDGDAGINPDATEVCDDADNDCDGLEDESDAADALTWYADTDGDGFGDADDTQQACEQPSGTSDLDTDCDDGDAGINPDAEETCDGVDTNCDGVLMAGGDDADGDGISNCEDPEVYAEDFSSGSGWSSLDLGGGNSPAWNTSSGYAYEASNAARTFIYSEDLGELDTYTITVDIYNSTSANNQCGIVFAYDGGSDYYAAIWNDPTGYYGSAGAVYLYDCTGSSCTLLAEDDGSADLTTGGASTWVEMSVSVDYDDITVTLDGVELFTYTDSGASPIGMNRVGLYSFDNDGGVYYDDLVITNP